MKMRRLIILVLILVVILAGISLGTKYLPQLATQIKSEQVFSPENTQNVKVVSEDSIVVDVYKKVIPSVVTVAVENNQQSLSFDSQDPFSFFNTPQDTPAVDANKPQNIGSGFIISKDGIIVTNKHVVSDRTVHYDIIASDNKNYPVKNIYRDPLNDIAILKVDASNLPAIELGDSSHLQVGQTAIAIGTPLGEFNGSVTKGIISGLGRGIVAGSALEGYAEQLNDVIQTDAAINPGNSGGPLLNAGGQVIGVNTAVSQNGQNIGFALPINVIKDSLKNFNETGQFNRPYLGVAYQILTRDQAIRLDLPEGAYVQSVVDGSAAAKAGIQKGDIITKIDGQKVQEKSGELASLIAKKKVGDQITLTISREDGSNNEKTLDVTATLETAPEQ